MLTGIGADNLCQTVYGVSCPAGPNGLGAVADDDITLNETVNTTKRLFQVRHLLDLGPVEFTYGTEYAQFDNHTVLNAVNPTATGIGVLVTTFSEVPNCPQLGIANGPNDCAFLLVDPVMQRASSTHRASALEAYAQARWKIDADLWLEGGAYYRDIDRGANDKRQVDPRLGLGWRVTPHHWLRASSQSALVDALRTQDTLAPVATVGTVVPDAYFVAGDTLPATWYHQLRWDAEWSSHIYSFVQVDQQDVEDFALGFVPDSRFALFGTLAEGRLNTVSFGTNLWLAERFGLAVNYKYLWSENRSDSAAHGFDLPLIPEQDAHTSLVWVHPRAVTLGLTGNYTGRRAANVLNTRSLAGYWTAGAFANWQPFARHLSLTVSADNLLDADYALAEGFAGPGTSVLFSAEYRF